MPQQAPIQSPKGNSRRSRRNERSLPGEDGASRWFWWENHLWMEDFHCHVWLPVWLGKNNGINGRIEWWGANHEGVLKHWAVSYILRTLPCLVPWLPSPSCSSGKSSEGWVSPMETASLTFSSSWPSWSATFSSGSSTSFSLPSPSDSGDCFNVSISNPLRVSNLWRRASSRWRSRSVTPH